MKFDPQLYIYPPRPMLGQRDWPMVEEINENPSWVAELKLNGDRCLLYVLEDRVEFWSRHGHQLKRFKPNKKLLDAIAVCGIPINSIVDAELLHLRHHSIKYTLLFYDVVAWGGVYVNTLSLAERTKFLDCLTYGPQVWRSIQYRFNLFSLFDAIRDGTPHPHLTHCMQLYGQNIEAIIEGLVLKNLNGTFRLERKSSKDVGWMLKLRIPHKNYAF